jgi:dTDP-4-amino-4,6-dideoxygalactose transaminase
MLVPYLDLTREFAAHREEFQCAMSRVIQNGRYLLGAETEAFETEFAAYLGVGSAVAVGSGTDALALALDGAAGLRPANKPEVITSALSAAFTALAIHHSGSVPRFVDVDPKTLQMTRAAVEAAVNERTGAILPVHLYGNACDIEGIADLSRERGLALLEDACQAHASRVNGRLVGTFGQAAAFSFYPSKNVGAFGDAGMLATSDAELAACVRKLRHGGQSRTYEHELLGRNSRMDELQAAVLRVKLGHLEARNEARRKIANIYDQAFAPYGIAVPHAPGALPNRHIYAIRVQQRDALREFLLQAGVETLVHYPKALPAQPALQPFVLPGQRFEAAERAAREVLSLPLYPELRPDEVEFVINRVSRFCEDARTSPAAALRQPSV